MDNMSTSSRDSGDRTLQATSGGGSVLGYAFFDFAGDGTRNSEDGLDYGIHGILVHLVACASVEGHSRPPLETPEPLETTVTDTRGRYAFEGLATPGEYAVMVSVPAWYALGDVWADAPAGREEVESAIDPSSRRSACFALGEGEDHELSFGIKFSEAGSPSAAPPPSEPNDTPISHHFPAEGIDFFTGNRAGVIFDMSFIVGTVTLAEGVVVPRPTTVASVVPSNEFRHSLATSHEMTLHDASSIIAESYSDQWSAGIPLTKKLGLEVGGSRDARLAWVRRQISSSQKYAVSSKFEYHFVEMIMKPAVEALLAEKFLRAFALLPLGPWDSFTDADRGAYAGFLRTYGTHYVHAAKFGGSYETFVVAEACKLVLASGTGTKLEQCASAKLSLLFAGILGIEAPIASTETCRNLTSTGRATDAWESSSIKSMQLWRGGSFDKADSLQFNDTGAWVEDLKRNPRSIPTQLHSVPDLFRELLGAYDFGEMDCLACQTLKALNLDKGEFAAILRNLDLAFDQSFAQAKQEKLDNEACKAEFCDKCELVRLNKDCSCPRPSADTCLKSDDDVIEVSIQSINIYFDKPISFLSMFTSGLGSDWDGKEYHSNGKINHFLVTNHIPTVLSRRKGETVHIEVIQDLSNRYNCVGSTDYPLELVGTNKRMDLNLGCSRKKKNWSGAGGNRVGVNPTVQIIGSLRYPNCCDCTVQSYSRATSDCNTTFAMLLMLVSLIIVL